MHVVTNTPVDPMEAVRSYSSISGGLPHLNGGSASALGVSRPARCLLALQPTCSRSRLNGSLHRRLRRLRCLCRRFDCYRVERTSSRAGLYPAEKHRLSRRTIRGSLVYFPALDLSFANQHLTIYALKSARMNKYCSSGSTRARERPNGGVLLRDKSDSFQTVRQVHANKNSLKWTIPFVSVK